MMGFYNREYKSKARLILKESINSAVFIDENAINPFMRIPTSGSPDAIQTQKLSKGLYAHFDKNNITLDIHRFVNIEKAKAKIKNKDIVLLDWHLEGLQSGEELALELLEEIVKEEHIHFCCIYTNSPKDSVINNCVSFFSGYTASFCKEVLEEYEVDEDLVALVRPFLERIFSLQNPNNLDEVRIIAKELKKIKGVAKRISEIEPLKEFTSFNCKLHCLAYVMKSSLRKSNNPSTPTIDFLNRTKHVFTINNTVVIILNKDHSQDRKKLFDKILNEIIEKHNSYLLMLGLEMQSYIKKSCAFITGDVLDVKNETLAFHWNQNIKNQNEISFEEFVKQIMIDQVDSKIKHGNFSLLKKENFLNEKMRGKYDPKQFARINTFYNGSKINGERLLNYGDILFSRETKTYYLCITALCDCLHPQNINNRFFFVKGNKYNIEKAIDLSDEAFISYINDDECISWVQTGPNSDKDNHRPVYIKPVQIFIPNSVITNNQIGMLDWGENNEVINVALEYMFTLRSQYAQRISNHAFSHPLRVGIDFLKITK